MDILGEGFALLYASNFCETLNHGNMIQMATLIFPSHNLRLRGIQCDDDINIRLLKAVRFVQSIGFKVSLQPNRIVMRNQ